MAISSLEEILEQRRRQQATAQRNAQRSQTRGNPTRTKDDEYKPPARPSSTAPARVQKDDVYVPPKKVVAAAAPARKPIYEPVKFVPAGNSQRTKDDAASANAQPQRYVPAPYLPPGKEKDDKSSPERPRYMPVIKPFEIAPAQGMQVGLTGDRPDTGGPGLYQSDVAGAQTTGYDARTWRNERTKDDEAFPQPARPMFGPQAAGGNNLAFNPGVSPGVSFLANNVDKWGNAAAGVVGDAGQAVTDKLDQFGAWGANATGQGDPWTALQNTPGGEYARLRDQERRADDKNAWDRGWSNVASFVDQTMYVPGKALETTPIPGLGVSAGQVGSAAGEAVNRWANPFNPNQINKEGKSVETPTTNAAFDWMKQNLPIELANGLVPFVQPWTTMWDIGAPQLEKSKAVRANYEALTPEQQQQANIAGVNIISGPDRWQKSIDALLNKDTTVQDLENKAREAMAAGDAQAAAAYGAQAYKLQNTSATDLVDEQSNPWAEIMGGIVLDPTNVLPFGVIGDAWKAYRLNKTFNVAEAVGISRLDDAMKASEKILQGVQPGQVIDMRNWWQKVNPLARTADTEAHMAADQLFSATAQMFGNVTTKQDAIALMQTWLQAPQKLIQGVTGLTSPQMAEQAVEGVYKVGAGVLANESAPKAIRALTGNKSILDQYPILQRAAAELQNMRSLAGEGAFNPTEFMAEADNIIYQNARKMFGLDALDVMPEGAVTTRLRRLADGTGVIEYLDKGKKVISTSTPEVFANAQESYKTLQKAIKSNGGNAAANALRMPDRLQRAIMSDMFLALRPAHWIRNASSATATLMSDKVYSLAPLKQRVNFWANKFGGVMPEAGLFGALEDTARGIANQAMDAAGDQNWTRAYWPKNNPYAALVEAGNAFWSGFTNLNGIPFGENAFRMTAFDTAGQRVFRKGWQDAVKQTYAPVLEQLGLDQGIVGRVLNAVTDAGIVGDKAGVAQAARNILSKNTLPFNLRDLDIPDELVSLEAWKKLNSYIADALPTQVDEVADAVRMTFNDELQRYGRILNTAPPQPGVYAWTNVEAAQDGADIIDNLMEAAKRAGIDPAQAQQRAQQLVGGLNQATGKAWETFRQELAQANSPGALNLAMDTWAQYYDLKRAARAEVDGFSKQAIAANSSQAWAQKWQETQRIWQEFGQKSQELFDSGRNGLLTLGQGGDVPKQYDWFDVIKRYVDYDEAAIRTARTAGQGVGGMADNAFSQAIEANRQYLDGSVAEVFDAFRRSPTMESFDLLVNAQRKIDQLGAQAATYLAEKRGEMLPKRAKEYYKLRNNVWSQFFDNAVVHNNATQRLIVADGVAQQAASKLRWTDEFAGGEFKLIGKNADGTWQAMRLDDQTMHNFADATVKSNSALPTVPKEITNDFYRVTNDTEKIVDDVIADIKASAAPSPATAAPVAAPVQKVGEPVVKAAQPTATQDAYRQFDARSVERTWEASGATTPLSGGLPARTVPAPEVAPIRPPKKSVFETRPPKQTVTTVGDVAKGQVDGIAEARNALRSEWDRVAVGEWQLPKLDTLNMQYNRNGVVNIPENLAEDLYGQTIAGRRIDSQKDVEDLIAEYASMKRQGDKAAATVADSQQFKKLDRTQLLKQFKDDLTGAGYSSDDLARMNRREVLNAVETLSGETADEFGMVMYESTMPLIDTDAIDAAYRAQNPYNINLDWSKKTGWDPFGLSKDDSDLYKLIGDTVKRKNPNKAPEMADVAQHMADQLKRAERQIIDRLPEILQGTPNNLTPAQRLQAVDALNQLLPQFDNVLAQSTQAGKDAMNFAMLNFRDRRNIDTALAMVTPFHYFWSRSAMNWGKRVLQKPALLNMWYESERAIGLENNQQNLPQRLQGTLPNPLNQFGIGNERMGNPVNWILPFASYMGNEFSSPDEAQGEFERMYLMWKKWTPGLLPALQYAADTALDKTNPQADGRQRTDSYQVGDYVPLYRMAGYMKQLLTGENLPQAGDEWDEDRKRRALAEGATNGADDITSMYAQQISKNAETGQPLETKVPPEMYDAAYKLYIQSGKAAGGDRLESLATGYMTGNPTYNYNPAEQQAQQKKAEYGAAGWDQVMNRFGSKAARTAIVDANPDVPVWWSRSADSPGDKARTTQYWNEIIPLYEAQSKAIGEFLTANPNATRDELKEFKKESQAAIDAVKAKYGDLESGGGEGGRSGMNPREQAQSILEDVLTAEVPGKPADLPENATPEQKRAYWSAMGAWTNKKYERIEAILNQKLGEEPSFPDPAQEELRKLVEGEYASELLRKNWLKYATDAQKTWDARTVLNEEIERAQWATGEANVLERMGEEGVSLTQQYFALPKGSEERRKFKLAHPETDAAIAAMYNPTEYDQVIQEFGADAWEIYANAPKGPGFDAPEAAKQAYYAELDKYAAQHPEYTAIDMFIGGRTRKYNPDAQQKYYDWGKDYEEGIRIFGPDIYTIADNFPSGASDAEVGAYFRAHPELSGYFEWVKAKKNEYAPVTAEAEPTPIDPATYTGERPVGSGRVPIDGEPGQSFFDGFGSGNKTTPTAGGFTSAPAVGAAMPTTTQAAAGPSAAQEADGDLTWQQWAGKNEKYAANAAFGTNWDEYNALKGDNAARAAYMKAHPEFADMYASKYSKGEKWWENYTGKGKGSGDFKAASNYIATNFTPEQNAQWKAYYALPDAQREAYKLAHPEIRVMTMAGYNPTEYEQAAELFGDDAWTEWANIPAYADTPEAKAARAAYLEEHPQAKLLSAWLNGRPSNFDESRVGDDFAYNFGEDFAQAQEMFGEDIWSIWAGYSSGWDKATKKAYHNQYPKLGEMMDWWYGNEGGQTRGGYSGGRSGGYSGGGGGRSGGYSGGGGGYSGWGGGDDGYSPPVDLNMPYLQNEGLSRELQVEAPQVGQQRRNFSPDWWLKAGDRVGPEKMQRWRPQKQPY
jgi:hypothetical protein